MSCAPARQAGACLPLRRTTRDSLWQTTVYKTLNPSFDEAFTFALTEPAATLEIEVTPAHKHRSPTLSAMGDYPACPIVPGTMGIGIRPLICARRAAARMRSLMGPYFAHAPPNSTGARPAAAPGAIYRAVYGRQPVVRRRAVAKIATFRMNAPRDALQCGMQHGAPHSTT